MGKSMTPTYAHVLDHPRVLIATNKTDSPCDVHHNPSPSFDAIILLLLMLRCRKPTDGLK